MGSVVARWTGREARALREARRMSVRDFAAHLGVNDAAVSNWERRGAQAKLRYDTQQRLDTVLTQAGPEVADRFELILRSEIADGATDRDAPQAEMSPASAAHLGDRSGQRTVVLLDAAETDVEEQTYQPDRAAVERFRQFVDSAARVFVLSGGAGSGKTRLTHYLAREWSGPVDFQLHTCATGASAATSLATEIPEVCVSAQRR
jgi:transcriptional regulator with XRE-family HTH domain